MSWLYRPTPVVVMGGGRYSSRKTLNRLPGSVMNGIPVSPSVLGGPTPSGAASRMRRVDTRFQPWIKTSGTMGSFIPNGLGDDSSLPSDFFSGLDASPTIPDPSSSGLPSDFFSGLDSSPTIPNAGGALPIDLSAPNIGTSFNPNIPAPIATYSGPVAPPSPPAGAGPTGTGIPGTRPVNPPASQASGLMAAAAAVRNWLTPAPKAPSGYTALPGYGGAPATYGGASWFSQRTIAPSIGSNGMVLGVAVVVLLVLAGGGVAVAKR